jgi:GrpB-like predicted nucleotidyltransferase (UPF0157 family)
MADARVEMVAWDWVWPRRFAEQQPAVELVLVDVLTEPVQHIGSTSATGLAAKPMIDMLATVPSLQEARIRVQQLSEAGWLFWPDDPNRDYRLWFLRPSPEARTHHLRVIQDGDPHAVALITFRDALRGHGSLPRHYTALKHALAGQHVMIEMRTAMLSLTLSAESCAVSGVEPPIRSRCSDPSSSTARSSIA